MRLVSLLFPLPEYFKLIKQLGRLASLNHNIYIAADPTHVDEVDHAVHVGEPTMCTQRIMTIHPFTSLSGNCQ